MKNFFLEILMNYNEVCLTPRYGVLDSRDDADVSCEFAGRKWRLPVVPANMEDTISFELAEWMESNNYFYILHRFYSGTEIYMWIADNQSRFISISIGVNSGDYSLLNKIYENNLRVDCITIDVAHGYAANVYRMAKWIKTYMPDTYLIIGNVSGDIDSILGVENWGADSIKVGLAYGKACTTYNQTGFATPMFSSGLDASKVSTVPLIGDGGIRENGDITKALVAGYNMVMIGSLFAACYNSPAPFVDKYNSYKLYTGSAAGNKYSEGISVKIQTNEMTYVAKLTDIENSLKSSVSYAGGKDLSSLKQVKWQKI